MKFEFFLFFGAFFLWIWYANKLTKTKNLASIAIDECLEEIRSLKNSILMDGNAERWSSDHYEEKRQNTLAALHAFHAEAGTENYYPKVMESIYPSLQDHERWISAQILKAGPFGKGWTEEGLQNPNKSNSLGNDPEKFQP